MRRFQFEKKSEEKRETEIATRSRSSYFKNFMMIHYDDSLILSRFFRFYFACA